MILKLAASLLVIVSVGIIQAAPASPAQNALAQTNSPSISTFSGSVMDVQTHQPIPKFTVTPARLGFGSSGYDWQEGQSTHGQNGSYRFQLPGIGNFALKVEAPGYLPEMSDFGCLGPNVKWDVALHKGKGFSGTVLGPDGRPVEGAQVAYSLSFSYLRVQGHKLVIWHSSTVNATPPPPEQMPFLSTDAQGRFNIPGVPGINSLLVFHDTGFAEIPRATLDGLRVVYLQPWDNRYNVTNQQGLYVRLVENQKIWPASATPQWKVEIQNGGRANLLSSTNAELWRVEVDGRWLGNLDMPRLHFGPLDEIKAGQTWSDCAFALDKDRFWGLDEFDGLTGMFTLCDGGSALLPLEAGKHTVRLAIFGLNPAPETEGFIQAISSPVEFEIAASSPPAAEVKPSAN